MKCWCGKTATIECQDCGTTVCRAHSKKVHDKNPITGQTKIKIFCDHCAGNAEMQGVKVTNN